jgi:phosphate:Na+ symporter
VAEISYVRSLINGLFSCVMDVYIHLDQDAMAKVLNIEDQIDDVTDKMSENHIARLDRGVCSADVGAQYLSLASNAERVADHLVNVANGARRRF